MTFVEMMKTKEAAERLSNRLHAACGNPVLASRQRFEDAELVANGFLDLLAMRVPERVELWAHGSYMDPSWGIGSSFIEVYW